MRTPRDLLDTDGEGYNTGGRVLPTIEAPVVKPSQVAPDPVRGSGYSAVVPSPAGLTLDLLRRARGGDSEALEALCRRYMPLLQRWATGRLPRAARERFDTGDLVQEVLFKALRHIEDFEPRHEGAFQVYLRKTLHNLIKDEIRRIRIHPRPSALGDDAVHPGPSPLEIAVGKELSERYEAALEKLKPEEREAIILRIEFNRSYQEIAEAMRKPSVDAARMAVSRALVRLARELKDAGVER